jgi:hypothetical protein
MTAQRAGRWVFGPTSDLLLGCGLLYTVVFVFFAAGENTSAASQLHGLAPMLLPFLSLPHYGATLLRVYERREERRRYAVFAVYATLVLFALFVAGVYNTWIGSLLLTIYITWGPWHYSGQNYGLALMFLRRRGANVTPSLKRYLYASFILSYCFVVFGMHSARGRGEVAYNPIEYGKSVIAFLPIGIDASITDLLFPLIAVAYLFCLGACARLLLRESSARDLVPVAVLAVTQALWFSIPFSVSYLGVETGIGPIDRHFDLVDFIFWVAMGHSVQYLWVTAYYARASEGWGGFTRYFGKTLLAGVAIWSIPVFLFVPDLLGPDSSWGAVGRVTAAVVNIHHFVLDGAIWKLREGRISNILLRPAPTGPAQWGPAAASWLRPGVWALLIGWCAFHVAGLAQQTLALRDLDPPDFERLRGSAQRLRWLGKDIPEIHTVLGVEAGRQGDLETARRELTRSLELQSSARAWAGMAFLEVQSDNPDGARAATYNALRLAPSAVDVWSTAAQVYRAIGDDDLAHEALKRAVEIAPERQDLWEQLRATAPDHEARLAPTLPRTPR